MFRLLSRLLLQRLSPRPPEAKSTSKLSLPVSRLLLATVVGISLLGFGWYYLKLLTLKMMDMPARAELHLQVLSSTNWPLVIYLQADDLSLPANLSGVLQHGRIESVGTHFLPPFQILAPASTLEIINNDVIPHNTHVFNRGDTIFNVATPLPGKSISKTLTGSGIFSVRCDLHPSMQTWLFVPPNDYYAVLDEPGTVSFKELPAGDYVVHLWHADIPEQLRLVSLASGESKTMRMH